MPKNTKTTRIHSKINANMYENKRRAFILLLLFFFFVEFGNVCIYLCYQTWTVRTHDASHACFCLYSIEFNIELNVDANIECSIEFDVEFIIISNIELHVDIKIEFRIKV